MTKINQHHAKHMTRLITSLVETMETINRYIKDNHLPDPSPENFERAEDAEEIRKLQKKINELI